MFNLAEIAADLDLIHDEKSNGNGDSSDDDYENSTNKRDNGKEELNPSRLENLILNYSDYDLTENHAGTDGSIA